MRSVPVNAPFALKGGKSGRCPGRRAEPVPRIAQSDMACTTCAPLVPETGNHGRMVRLDMDAGGIITGANEAFLDLTGYSSYDILGCHYAVIIDLGALRHIHADLGQEADELFNDQPGPIPLIARSQEIVWIYGAMTEEVEAGQSSLCLHGYNFDEIGHRLVNQAGMLRAVTQHFLVAEFDMDGLLINANPNFLEAFGYTQNEICGMDHACLVDPAYAASGEYVSFWSGLRHGVSSPVHGLRYGKGRREVWVDAAYHPVLDGNGVPGKVVMIGRDLTMQQRLERIEVENRYRAESVDVVTNLENRTAFRRSTQKYFNPVTHKGDFQGVLALFDIDNFTALNSSYGNEACDAILWMVGHRIRDALRRQDLVSRLDRDLFGVFIENVPAGEDSHRRLIERILKAIATSIDLGQDRINITASAGLVCGAGWKLAREVGEADILSSAQAALLAAKSNGPGSHRFFDAELAQATLRRQMIERDMEGAMLSGEITLHYQPVVAFGSSQVAGYEALARWTHPVLGAIPPPEFIGIAERSGMIHALGQALLRQASCFIMGRQSEQWVAVNVSPIQLQRREFHSEVQAIIAEAQVPPHRIDIEITESASLDASFVVQENIRQLRACGFSISLDDFGTGFSSLSQLLRLRADRIKIDQSFTQDCENSQEKVGIIRSIIGLGTSMGMKVVAEGVETSTSAALLRELGCDYGQGYLFGRPVHPDKA